MAFLDLDRIHKRFGAASILQDISIAVQEGEFLVLVGPSGCGKSTLMNIIAGLEPPSGGRLALGGRDITHAAPAERDISMVFQSYALYPNMTVAGNIGFPLENRADVGLCSGERGSWVPVLLVHSTVLPPPPLTPCASRRRLHARHSERRCQIRLRGPTQKHQIRP